MTYTASTFKLKKFALATATATAVATLSLGMSYAQTAVVVNKKIISSATVDFIIKQQPAPDGKVALPNPEQRKMIIDRMIDMELLAQDAVKQNLVKNKEFDIELDLVRTQLLARAAIKAFQEKTVISDADAKAKYDQEIKAFNADGKEYKARHILVDNEAQAKDIIAKLKANTKFEDLVKQSKDQGSVEQGGDLGYALPSSYTKAFADALLTMKKGELSQSPVKTEYGYHVIEVTDIRDIAPPSFNDVKDQVKADLIQQKMVEYQQSLRKAAVIK